MPFDELKKKLKNNAQEGNDTFYNQLELAKKRIQQPDYTPSEAEQENEDKYYKGVTKGAASSIPVSGSNEAIQNATGINPFGRIKALFQKNSPQLEEVKNFNPELYRLQKYGEVSPAMKAASEEGNLAHEAINAYEHNVTPEQLASQQDYYKFLREGKRIPREELLKALNKPKIDPAAYAVDEATQPLDLLRRK